MWAKHIKTWNFRRKLRFAFHCTIEVRRTEGLASTAACKGEKWICGPSIWHRANVETAEEWIKFHNEGRPTGHRRGTAPRSDKIRQDPTRPPSPAKAAMPSATRPARPAENLRGGSVITITFGGSSAASAKKGWARLWLFSKCLLLVEVCQNKMERCSLNSETMENRNHGATFMTPLRSIGRAEKWRSLDIMWAGFHPVSAELGWEGADWKLHHLVEREGDCRFTCAFKRLICIGTRTNKIEKIWHLRRSWVHFYTAGWFPQLYDIPDLGSSAANSLVVLCIRVSIGEANLGEPASSHLEPK